ncbi:ubiquitin carboxyl-terminal hydrolase-domain-containing protein [Tricladium varicosporioides]|nr:ubiquitin carboxyl-terminal hydrolase-domain-containing protein [Hymenoscyphus varicosporioides]
MNRFLSKREKNGPAHRREKSSDRKTRPLSSDGLLSLFKTDPQKKIDKEFQHKITTIRDRLHHRGYTNIDDEQINYALSSKYASGSVDIAFEVVLLFQESVEGIIKPYSPSTHMLGAENRENVTCYLDALLFAMFARLDSFEPMLMMSFDDEPRRRLSTLIRLWVNMLRTGKLIQTDVTGYLQEALAASGWPDAGKLEQQDTSEAFSFITGALDLPLLTLKMDIYHTGREDDTDDHKFVQERLLEVGVPETPKDSTEPIKLEDCLENYFNNRIDVVRQLERSNTRASVRSASGRSHSVEKESSQHVEITELSWATPDTPSTPITPITPISPGGRHRGQSIIRHRVVLENDDEKDEKSGRQTPTLVRKGSIRKEVLMPAWQFFNLIPWYTKHSPTNDAEVAAHFSKARPVLGICLKRYAMSAEGVATRKNTFIDIPLDIRLPHFIPDDEVPQKDGPLMGNFKLSLQSVICHRGNSVHSGHYISFVRGLAKIADGDYASARRLSNGANPPQYPEDRWIKFDDLANPRVSYVDIEQAMKDEMPYLLFYQVQPTYEMSAASCPDAHPPSYADSAVGMSVTSPESFRQSQNGQSGSQEGYFDGAKDEGIPTPQIRFSSELERPDQDPPRRSINLPDERRGSLAFTETSLASSVTTSLTSAPVTPSEETTAQRMSRAAQRFTKSANKSRPTSASGENRLSLTLSRLNWRASKEQLGSKSDPTKEEAPGEENIVPSGVPPESRESMATDDTHSTLKTDGPTPGRSKSRMGRKRDKSKDPSKDLEHEHHHHFIGKGKEKSKDKPKDKDIDRECILM